MINLLLRTPTLLALPAFILLFAGLMFGLNIDCRIYTQVGDTLLTTSIMRDSCTLSKHEPLHDDYGDDGDEDDHDDDHDHHDHVDDDFGDGNDDDVVIIIIIITRTVRFTGKKVFIYFIYLFIYFYIFHFFFGNFMTI
ncbi:unnamed protein product [Enterobius vermicularis]|uniref:Secreted protein n=1 Tax=Enterobius vermicularis TaxID=51028 RepID=A0A0N4VNY9_ENTVE|nr:unnamed protein product [Enterobius vermicularis]